MQKNKKMVYLNLALGFLVFGVITVLFAVNTTDHVVITADNPRSRAIKSFDECVAAGFPVLESYPRKCHTDDGRRFVEEIEPLTIEGEYDRPEEQSGLPVPPKDPKLSQGDLVAQESDAQVPDALPEGFEDSEDEKEGTSRIEKEVDRQEALQDVVMEESDLLIRDRLIHWGFTPSGNRLIDAIILHSSYNSLGGDEYDIEAIIGIYKQYGVGAHYIIARNGEIIRLIEENNIAYHAGVSKLPDGRTDVNAVSIGIEIIGNVTDGYTDAQYGSVQALVNDIASRYDITYTLGHDEIAPDRKTDPWNFNWDKLIKP